MVLHTSNQTRSTPEHDNIQKTFRKTNMKINCAKSKTTVVKSGCRTHNGKKTEEVNDFNK